MSVAIRPYFRPETPDFASESGGFRGKSGKNFSILSMP
jgi:hypothetical protein